MDHLQFAARSHGAVGQRNICLVQLVIAQLGLRAFRSHQWKHLSSGYKMRFELARALLDRKSTRLNSSHLVISYAVFCLKKNMINYRHESLEVIPGYGLARIVIAPVMHAPLVNDAKLEGSGPVAIEITSPR